MIITKEKIKATKKKLKNGYPQEELIADLSSEGYSEEEISYLLNHLSDNSTGSNGSKEIPLWYAASIGFIILGIGILSVKYLWLYYWGYFFLIAGFIGLVVNWAIDASKKK